MRFNWRSSFTKTNSGRFTSYRTMRVAGPLISRIKDVKPALWTKKLLWNVQQRSWQFLMSWPAAPAKIYIPAFNLQNPGRQRQPTGLEIMKDNRGSILQEDGGVDTWRKLLLIDNLSKCEGHPWSFCTDVLDQVGLLPKWIWPPPVFQCLIQLG